MVITYTTGIFPFYEKTSISEEAVLKLKAAIHQWISVFKGRSDVELEVWVDNSTRSKLEIFKNNQVKPKIIYKDPAKFFKKANISYQDFWYDSLRFLILGYSTDRKYRIWIDHDTLIYPDSPIINYTPEDNTVLLHTETKILLSIDEKNIIQKALRMLGVSNIEVTDVYRNTGNIWGGDYKVVRDISKKVLEYVKCIKDIQKSPRVEYRPELFNLLEWGSCSYVDCLCNVSNANKHIVWGIFHWTGCNGLPYEVCEFLRKIKVPDQCFETYSSSADSFRCEFMRKLCTGVVSGNLFNTEYAISVVKGLVGVLQKPKQNRVLSKVRLV